MAQYETIAKDEQSNMLGSFWTMLRECDSTVERSKDRDGHYAQPILKHHVEGWYRQWNRVTGDNLQPSWIRNAEEV